MITIVTKSYCPYCHMAIALLDQIGLQYDQIDVTSDVNQYEKIKEISGSRTVPQIFLGDIHGKFLGGYDDFSDLYESGELDKIIQ